MAPLECPVRRTGHRPNAVRVRPACARCRARSTAYAGDVKGGILGSLAKFGLVVVVAAACTNLGPTQQQGGVATPDITFPEYLRNTGTLEPLPTPTPTPTLGFEFAIPTNLSLPRSLAVALARSADAYNEAVRMASLVGEPELAYWSLTYVPRFASTDRLNWTWTFRILGSFQGFGFHVEGGISSEVERTEADGAAQRVAYVARDVWARASLYQLLALAILEAPTSSIKTLPSTIRTDAEYMISAIGRDLFIFASRDRFTRGR